jgi:hypothetical protein
MDDCMRLIWRFGYHGTGAQKECPNRKNLHVFVLNDKRPKKELLVTVIEITL